MLAAVCCAALAFSYLGRGDLTLENIKPGELVRYPVVILKGRTAEAGVRAGLDGGPLVTFPGFNHQYVAIVELKPGINFVTVKAGDDSIRQRIDYRPMRTPYQAKAVWVTANDEPETTNLPGNPVRPDFRQRMDVALKLMQSFTAEAMHDAGYDRKTFPLELDRSGKVVVHIVRSPKTGKELRSMEAGASWSALYDQLGRELPGSTNHWFALLGFTGYENGHATGYYALGGGQLAAFGAGSVGYWPRSITEVAKVFANRKEIDVANDFDDSAYRKTVWANASTCIGAWLHEAGHTFGLPHSPDGRSIMSRGFDFFNRAFMSYEPPSARLAGEHAVSEDMRPKWDPFFAAVLNWNPFFQADGNKGREFPANDPPKISLDAANDAILVSARYPLRVVGAERDDTPAEFHTLKGGDTSLRLKLSDIKAKMNGKPFRVSAVDSMGQKTTIESQ